MPAGRKAALLAALILTILYLLHTAWLSSTPQLVLSKDPSSTSSSESKDGQLHTSSEHIAQPGSQPNEDEKLQVDNDAKSKSAGQTRPYPPPRGIAAAAAAADDEQIVGGDRRSTAAQRPMSTDIDRKSDSLVERLARHFQYNPDGRFPAYIWQTWRFTPGESGFDESFRQAEASWSIMHPGFVHEVVTDRNAIYLLRYLYASMPEVIEAYDALPMAVMKADFFRYLILLARGGIYTDMDTYAIKSATDWLPETLPRSSVGLVVGIEADPDREDWQKWYSRRIQLCQWTIQAKAGHPVLRNIVAAITEKTLALKKSNNLQATQKLHNKIVDLTGPAIWTDTILAYLNDPSFFRARTGATNAKASTDHRNVSWETFTRIETPKKVGDVVVLPITCFSPGVKQMGAKEPDDPMAYVKHEFMGSWKPEEERIHTESDEEKDQPREERRS